MRTLLLITILAVTASSCGPSLGAAFHRAPMPADPLKSLVYVYRPKKFVAGKLAVQMVMAHEPEVWGMELNNGAYIPYVVNAGKLKLVAQHVTGKGELELDVQPQKEYYVRVTVDSVSVTEVTPDVGASQIRECSYEPSTDRKKRFHK